MNNFFGTPLIASEHGAEIDRLMWLIHGLMAVLFLGWLAYYIYVLIRFRQSKNPVANYTGVKSHFSSYLEAFVAMTEGVLLVGFAIPIWASWAGDYPEQEDALEIRLAAQQFAWNARYAGIDGEFGSQKMELAEAGNPLGYDPEDEKGKDDVAVINDINVPVDTPVIVHVSSMDVIHSFAVRALRVCQDATPGLSIPVSFTANRTGSYRVTCAQLCGNLHFSMGGRLHVMEKDEFNEWYKSESESATSSGGGGMMDFGGFDDAFGGGDDAFGGSDDGWGDDSSSDDDSSSNDSGFGGDAFGDDGFGSEEDDGFGDDAGFGDDEGWGDEESSDDGASSASETVEESVETESEAAPEPEPEPLPEPEPAPVVDEGAGWNDEAWGDFSSDWYN